MPIRHSIIHQIDKKPDGSPAVLHISDTDLAESQATENLLHDLNVAYNAKARPGASSMLSPAPSLSAAGCKPISRAGTLSSSATPLSSIYKSSWKNQT